MDPERFVGSLSALEFDSAFNPYSSRCEVHDVDDAPQRRRATLLAVLAVAAKQEIDSLWIARDLGYRGGRRTGLALTDDAHIQAHAARWGLSIPRPTRGGIVTERTAAVIWRVLSRIDAAIFLWNVFPLHPHEPGNPFSNRAHNHGERQVGQELLSELIELLEPYRLVAIGSTAASALHRIGGSRRIEHVRHPSFGGQRQFVTEMCQIYGLEVGLTAKPCRSRSMPGSEGWRAVGSALERDSQASCRVGESHG